MSPLTEIIADTLKIAPDAIEGKLTIHDLDSWDSLSHINLIASIEEAYNIRLTGDEIAEMVTIDAIYKIVGKYLSGTNGD